MSKKIYGGLDVTHNVTVKGKRTVQGINDQVFDDNGNMELDTYTKEEILDVISMMPLSHYGTHNYLPAGVSGDFNGASENTSQRRNKILLEDDGTLVMLRAGTNGSVEGLFYSYLANALTIEDMGRTVNTGKQYQPGFLGSTKVAFGLYNTDSNIMIGQYKDTTNSTTGYFVSITNNTLDDTQHSGFIINQYTDLSPQGNIEYAMMAEDGSIYVFSLDVADNKMHMIVQRIVFNISAGTYTTSRISGWTTKTFYNTTISANTNIVLTNRTYSTDIVDKPYALVPTNLRGIGIYMTSYDLYVAQQPGTQNFRFRLNGDLWATMADYNTRPQHSFSFNFNMSTKQCTLDTGNDIGSFQAPIVITNTGTQLVATGNALNKDDFYNHSGARNIYSGYYYSVEGVAFCTICPNLAEPLHMEKGHYPAQSVYSMINVRAVSCTDFRDGRVGPTFGSAVGSYINGVELLPDNSTKQFSRASGTGSYQPSYAVHKSTPNFTFKSLSMGTIQGYEPTAERANVADTTNNRVFISSISGSTVTTNGGVLICGQRYSQSLSYDKYMNGTNVISVTQSVLDNFRTAEYAKVASSWNLSSASGKDMSLFVPQQSDIPAFVFLSSVTNNNQNYIRVAEVNVNTRVGNITSITFKRLVYENVHGDNFVSNTSGSFSSSSVGMTIYDGGSFYFLGGSDPLTHNTIGNTNTHMFRAYVTKSTATIDSFIIAGGHASYEQGAQPAALPGLGFGIFAAIDYSNKMTFVPFGTTIADYNAWTQKATAINLVSQDVAQGFIVYFTEETPVILSGKSFTLPISNIDLTTVKANPANTTFYLYIKMEQGNVKYHITTEVISEAGTSAYNVFWIGTIKTNSLQIETVNVEKRSRLDIFGASLEAAGSSFPVSYGLPSQTGSINW